MEEKRLIGIYKCFPITCGGLRLTFPWADVGSEVFVERVNHETVRLHTRKTKKAYCTVTVKIGGRKYINVNDIINPGFQYVYKINETTYEVHREIDESKIPDRVKTSWSKNEERISSTGHVVIPADKRKRLFYKSSGKNANAFKMTIDVTRGVKAWFEPICTDDEEFERLPIRQDFLNNGGVSYLEKYGRVQYKIVGSTNGGMQLPAQMLRMLGDRSKDVQFDYVTDNKGAYKALYLHKELFFCPDCGAEEMWDVSEPIAVHVCPNCMKSLTQFKQLIPGSYLNDMDAFREGVKVVDNRINLYKGLLAALESVNGGMKNFLDE